MEFIYKHSTYKGEKRGSVKRESEGEGGRAATMTRGSGVRNAEIFTES